MNVKSGSTIFKIYGVEETFKLYRIGNTSALELLSSTPITVEAPHHSSLLKKVANLEVTYQKIRDRKENLFYTHPTYGVVYYKKIKWHSLRRFDEYTYDEDAFHQFINDVTTEDDWIEYHESKRIKDKNREIAEKIIDSIQMVIANIQETQKQTDPVTKVLLSGLETIKERMVQTYMRDTDDEKPVTEETI